jgi:hypothetical protein
MLTDLEIEFHLTHIVPQLQQKVNAYFESQRSRSPIIIGKSFLEQRKGRQLCVKEGRRYYKLFLREGGEWGGSMSSVYAFVRKGDGAVLKASSWSKPETRTKSAIRGYINDDNVLDYFDYYGVKYAVQY